MPPPGSGVPALTYEEKLKITRWIDLGAPIHFDQNNLNHPRGYFADDLRPTLILSPDADLAETFLKVPYLRVGAYDLESGIEPASLVVTATQTLFGVPAGQNIAANIPIQNGQVLGANIPEKIDLTKDELAVYVEEKDKAGHVSSITRTYHKRPCRLADVTCDSHVDVRDITAVITGIGSQFETTGLNVAYDQDGDGDVDFEDVQLAADDWGWDLFE